MNKLKKRLDDAMRDVHLSQERKAEILSCKSSRSHQGRKVSPLVAAAAACLLMSVTAFAANELTDGALVHYLHIVLDDGSTKAVQMEETEKTYRYEDEDYQVEIAKDGSWGVYGGNAPGTMRTEQGVVTIQPNESTLTPVPQTEDAGEWLFWEDSPELKRRAEENIHTFVRLQEVMTDQQYEELYDHPDRLSAMQRFLQRLAEEFDTLESDYDGGSITKCYQGWCDLPDSFVEGATFGMKNQQCGEENGETLYRSNLYALQIGERLNEQMKGCLSEGRAFEEKEFAWEKGEDVPVILGSAYRTYYSVGDEVPFSFFPCEGEKVVVVGFLQEDTLYFSRESARKMNGFAVFPFADYKELEEAFREEAVCPISVLVTRMFDQYILLDGMDGEEQRAATKKISALLDEYGLAEYYRVGEVSEEPLGFHP